MIDFRAASDALADLIEQLDDDDLARATPCESYTVSDLLMHIDEGATGFTAAACGEISSPAVTAVNDDASRGKLADHVRDLAKAWAEPRAWDGDSDLAGLELPNETWGKIAMTEVIVHGWDLAVATHRGFVPPESVVLACHDHVQGFLTEAPLPELWGEPVPVDATLSLLDRTVAIAGRDPRSWRLAPPA
ncbi:TIGR03086 family metal-binding protein [Williamsia soli]|uniref:TIGR03086 family metal-binding protein n=1 Tax=Williamsia soli TaxID=364929 RepID=UPI001A9CC960|nr:TIGR03086 family metal-binding protein [Williamsia soli]